MTKGILSHHKRILILTELREVTRGDEMNKFIVLLDDQTIGEIYADTLDVGEEVTVVIHDEDGNPNITTGTVEEMLEKHFE